MPRLRRMTGLGRLNVTGRARPRCWLQEWDRRHRLAEEPLVVAAELVEPERADHRVLHLLQDPVSVTCVTEYPLHAEDRLVADLQQGHHARVQDVLHPHAPGVT